MSNITVIGLDLAKDVFQLHGTDKAGHCVYKKRLKRDQLVEEMAQLSPCIIGIEACGGAHAWARCFIAMGHEVRMVAPQYVKPFVKTNKNDANDAEAIAEAVMRPNMRFVPIKTLEQQDMQLVHTVRQLTLKHRIALGNEIRGLLQEYGIIIRKGAAYLRTKFIDIIKDESNQLTSKARAQFEILDKYYKDLDDQVAKYDAEIACVAKEDERCRRLMKIEGVGPVIASAIVAAIGDAKAFKSGRGLSAWLGLVPKQYSSGHKIRQSGISKRGNVYLRTLLIHGARAVVRCAEKKLDSRSRWITSKKIICENKAAVALANKNARIIWVMLTKGENYQPAQIVV